MILRAALLLLIAPGFLGLATPLVHADVYTDGIQGELNLFNIGEGLTVANAPAAALIAATSAAISDDFSPSPEAFNYVRSVLAARADRLKIVYALVNDAVLTIGGAAADSGDVGLIVGAAAGVAGMTDAGRAAAATGAISADSAAVASIVNSVAPRVTDKVVFAKSGVVNLGNNPALITAFVRAVIDTGVPTKSLSDTQNFTLTVALASARNAITATAVVTGGATALAQDADKQALAALAITKIPAATVNIATAVGALVSDKPAFAVALAANRTAAAKGLVAEGVLVASPVDAAVVVTAILNADKLAARPVLTIAARPAFAATAASGVLSNLPAVSAVASAVAAGQTDVIKGLIASALAAKLPASAGQIAVTIIAGGIANKPAFAATVAKTAAVLKTAAQVADVAKQIAATTTTDDDKAAIAAAVILATGQTTAVAQSVSQLITGANAEALGTAQAGFAAKLALKLPTLASSIAVGVAMNNPLFAGDIAVQTVKASATTLRYAATIAGALAKALPDNAVDVAVELGALMNDGTLPLAYAPAIATALAAAPGVKGDLTFQRLAAVAFDLVALIPSPATTANNKILLQVIANIVRQNVNAGPLIAGAAAEAAVDYFAGLTTTQRDAILTQIENTVKAYTPASLDNAVINNVEGVRNRTLAFQLGGLAPHESPFAPD